MSAIESKHSRSKPTRRASGSFWNALTILSLVGSLVLVALFLVIYTDPYTAVNPFPPPTLPVAISFPSNTPAPTEETAPAGSAPSTATFTPEPSPTLSPTHTPDADALPTLDLPITLSPSPTPRPTATPGGFAFVAQEGSPSAIPYGIYSDVGCNYLGVGGRVLGLDGGPVTPGVIVRLRGFLNGRSVSIDTLSGTATQFGESGFAFQLGDQPVASRNLLYVQLLDQSYLPMSPQVYFDTYSDCDKNLVFITFRQMR
jgi:hypothetical protein